MRDSSMERWSVLKIQISSQKDPAVGLTVICSQDHADQFSKQLAVAEDAACNLALALMLALMGHEARRDLAM